MHVYVHTLRCAREQASSGLPVSRHGNHVGGKSILYSIADYYDSFPTGYVLHHTEEIRVPS